ncbi:MAG: N-acetylmuramoyl-L-alanine amidase [Bacillota bacterium]
MPRYFPQRMPSIWSRESWTARPPAGKLSPLGTPHTITLHHTLSAPAPPYREIRTIQEYHLSRGFYDIGYHFLVDRPSYVSGQDVYWGRETQPDGSLSLGAHARDHNQGNIGVAVLGNYEVEQPSPAQLQTLAALLAWLCFVWDIDPASIVPHSDLNPTSCPGKHLAVAIPWLRWQVTWWLHGLKGPAPTSPPEGDQVRIVTDTTSPVITGKWLDGMVWAPVRALAGALGRRVVWDEPTRTVYVFRQQRPLLNLPAPTPPQVRVVVEQMVLPLEPPARVVDSVSMAPLEPLAAAMEQAVLWHPPSRTGAVVTPPGLPTRTRLYRKQPKHGGGAGSCTRVRR